MSETDIITVPENQYGIEDVHRERPYLSTDADRDRWMAFSRLFQLILESRIDELNGRYNQIFFIREIKEKKLYLVNADRTISTSRAQESYFYDWLYELYDVHKIPVANRTTWDKIETNIAKCLGAGMTLERAIAVVAVGEQALKKLEESGVLVVKQLSDGTVGYVRGPKADDVIGAETNVDQYLERIADSTSSRGATMMVQYDLGKGKTASIENVWVDPKERELIDMKQYFMEVAEIDTTTGEKTPYGFRILAERDTPPEIVKYVLRSISSERWARAAFD